MDRREFLRLLGGAGIITCLPAYATTGRAAGPEPDRFWVMVHAGGGWDPTSLCDPKGDAPRADGRGPVNNYPTSAIKTAGNIRYSPYPAGIDVPTDSPGHFDNFFRRHHARLLVINGVDTETNSHSIGTRFVWSGKTEEGHPAFSALVAAVRAPERPMAFISNGGYDFTASLVGASRAGDVDTFKKLALPNNPYPNASSEESRAQTFIDAPVYGRVQAYRLARLQRQMEQASLPQHHAALSQLYAVRTGKSNLNRLVANLSGSLSNGLKGQAEIAAAAFASGLAVSANLSRSGFDTHGNHDAQHYPRLTDVLDAVDHLWDELVRHGIQDRTTIVIGSDFGRTPFYNDGNGKDHWNVTSVMAMGAGIRGNRVIGRTNAHHEAFNVNPTTLQPDPAGIRITPRHIHLALRRLAGIANHSLAQNYPVPAEALPLFG